MTLSVAAYCRVSTSSTDQANSFQAQKRYFTDYISHHPEWELYEIYADEGISGTALEHRREFNRMLADAGKGCFKYILTKEVSRFSRNIVDAINCTRELKAHGVGVIFMNDGINSLEGDSELRLSIMASIAQEESRKTSQRVKWGQTRQMERGVVFGHSLLGYSVTDGKLKIVDTEAEIVRKIFYLYAIEKMSSNKIAALLQKENNSLTDRHKVWSAGHIIKILRNEKYVGDLVQKKSYTPNYLDHKKKTNHDCEQKIVLKDHHEAIVSREMWEITQKELTKRSRRKTVSGCSIYSPLSGKIICGECGAAYVRRIRYRADGSWYYRWNCGGNLRKSGCSNGKSLRGEAAEQMLEDALRQVYKWLNVGPDVLSDIIFNKLEDAADELKNSVYAELQHLKDIRHLALEAFISGEIDRKEFETAKTLLIDKEKECEARLKTLGEAQTSLSFSAIETELCRLMSDKAFCNKLLSSMLDKIIMHGSNIAELYIKHIPEALIFT